MTLWWVTHFASLQLTATKMKKYLFFSLDFFWFVCSSSCPGGGGAWGGLLLSQPYLLYLHILTL